VQEKAEQVKILVLKWAFIWLYVYTIE